MTVRPIRRLAVGPTLAAVVWFAGHASAAPLQSLAVYPPDVQLATARGRQAVVVQAAFADDPDGDNHRLCREMPGRRVNLAVPTDSLMIEKATGKVPHTGGERLKPGDEYYQTLVRWLEAGCPQDPPDVAKPVAAELYPKAMVLDGPGEKQRMVVRAKYSDGTYRDVTNLALFLTNNAVSAKIGPDGVVTAGERGEAFV